MPYIGNLHIYIYTYIHKNRCVCFSHPPGINWTPGLPSADILIWWFGETFTVGIHNWDLKKLQDSRLTGGYLCCKSGCPSYKMPQVPCCRVVAQYIVGWPTWPILIGQTNFEEENTS